MSSAKWLFCSDCQEVYWEFEADDKIYCPKCQRTLEHTELSQLEETALTKIIAKCKDTLARWKTYSPSDELDRRSVCQITEGIEMLLASAKNLLRQLR